MCEATHPVLKLPCVKPGSHPEQLFHRAEREKAQSTHKAKDVFLWRDNTPEAIEALREQFRKYYNQGPYVQPPQTEPWRSGD